MMLITLSASIIIVNYHRAMPYAHVVGRLSLIETTPRRTSPPSPLSGHYFISACATSVDDKKLTTTLKRIGVTNIPAIEEVNMFTDDGEVIHFVGPKGKGGGREAVF